MSTDTKNLLSEFNSNVMLHASVCVVTAQRFIEELFTKNFSISNLCFKKRLTDIIGEKDFDIYVVDTEVPDMNIWPAPFLADADLKSKNWIFISTRMTHMNYLDSMPPTSLLIEYKHNLTDELTKTISKHLDPNSRTYIEEVHYVENIRAFVVRMANRKSYLLKLDELPEADSTRVIHFTVGKEHHHFRIKQESGNWFDVPWDYVLYHCEPNYEYYKGKQVLSSVQDRAKRIGERVREIRNTKGLSIEELAKKAGLKRPNLSRLEHGKHVPSLETLERLSIPLGVPVANIVAWPSENSQVMPPVSSRTDSVIIKVIGLGESGCNIVNRMIQEQIQDVEFIAMDTDVHVLENTKAPVRMKLGEKLTKGLGVGGDHIQGEKAAEENRDELKELISGADMVFITGGMGGGTGTGAAPVIAEIAKQSGALTIAVVTKPFTFEGAHRCRVAEEGIARLLGKVDTLTIIPNDRLLDLCDQKIGVDSAFKLADDVLRQGIQAIIDVITVPGMINLDFTDVKAVMKDAGPAWMAIGRGKGQNRAIDAVEEALASPLLDVTAGGSRGVLFNVVGDSSLTLFEVNEAAEIIKQAVDPEANIIFGVAHDPNMEREVKITLVATGFASKTGWAGATREEEFAQLLKEIKSEDELDVPSFLHRPLFSHRKQVITPATKSVRTKDQKSAPKNKKSTSNTTPPNKD